MFSFRYPAVLIYDEQAINQGVFPVQVGNETPMIAGMKKLLSVEDIDTDTFACKINSDPDYQLVHSGEITLYKSVGYYFLLLMPFYNIWFYYFQKHNQQRF